MLWPRSRVRHVTDAERTRRLAEARQRNPESAAWLGLLEAALSEIDDGARWKAAAPEPAAERPVKAPCLYRARISVDGGEVQRWVRRLLRVTETRLSLRRVDAVALLEAAVCQDDGRIDALAAAAETDAHALRVVAQMTAVPLLQSCARTLERAVPPSWWEGYCPICGAWPVLAESRGLERKRWLRCGRCGAGWEMPLLRCPFCDETQHGNLGYLAPEQNEQTRRVEVCKTCKGYLKSESTVRALASWAVLLDDFATLPLDVAALDRGYERPGRAGYRLDAQVTER